MEHFSRLIRTHVYVCVFAACVVLGFALYGNTVGGEFVYDDRAFVNREEFKEPSGLWMTLRDPYFIAKTTGHQGIRLVSSFTFALNFFLFGESPASFHIMNILLHALASFLVFVVVDLLFQRKLLSLFSAMLFLFLPIHTEAVAFIKARDEILMAVFLLLSWIAFIKATYRPVIHWPWMGASALAFLLALLSKEFAVTAPFLFLVVFFVQRRMPLKKVIVPFLSFLPAYGLYGFLAYDLVLRAAAGDDGSTFIINPFLGTVFSIRFWTAFKIAFLYIVKTVVPVNLSASYDYNQLTLVNNPLESWQALGGILLLALFVGSMVYKKTAATPIGIGAATFLIPYAVFSKFTVVGGQILGERWVYFASLGICLGMAYVLEKLYRRHKVFAIMLFTSIVVAYAAVLVPRNIVWRNERALFESMVNTAPNSIQGHKALALADLKAGDYERAIPHVEASMRIYIGYQPIISMLKRLSSYYSQAQRDGRAIAVRGSGEVNRKLLALAYANDGNYKDSLEILDRLVTEHPERRQHPIVRFTYALNYYHTGNIHALEDHFEMVPGTTREQKLENLRSF